jgi:hypothetical protein
MDLPIDYRPDGRPRYWRDETSGRLRGAVLNFVNQRADRFDLLLIQAYFQHWIESPVWDQATQTPELRDQLLLLRQSIGFIVDPRLSNEENTRNLRRWHQQSLAIGIDPL